jgi:hypothetical protein
MTASRSADLRRTHGVYEQLQVAGVPRHEHVRFESFDREDPAELPHQISIFRLGQRAMHCLTVGESFVVLARRRLREFFFD